MNPETFFDNFGILADVPGGVSKLRGLILQLAVQGKLVPQDENDEPASELLKLISSERNNAIDNKVIKKSQPLPNLVDDELPFGAPSGWAFERFGNLFRFIDYRGKTPKKVEAGIRLITAKNIRMGYRQDNPMEFITEKTYNEWMTRGFPEIGDLLFTTEAPMGNVCLVDLNEKFALAQRAINLHPWGNQNSQYLMFAIMSSPIQEMISAKATGMTATGIKAAKLKLVPVPLPPLNEQKRIVAKVYQLMALCDELEARQQKKQEARLRLNSAALDRLLTAHEPGEFANHWQRVCDNFDLLYDNPETVGELRKAILQLAVQGRLVRQDKNDEPAAVLLEKIKAEKERLVKEGGIKKSKVMPSIKVENMPYAVPSGWDWVRLETLCSLITKGSSPKWQGVNYTGSENGILFITSENVGNYSLILNKTKYVEKKFNEIEPRSILKRNDILMNIVGASIGRTAIFDHDNIANINQAVCIIRLLGQEILLNLRYLLHFFNSPVCISFMFDKQVDNARANLSMGNISKFLVPLPPLAEQKRIVARVDTLMALCDDLEAKLRQSQTDGAILMEAVVHKLVAA